jgi:hypothetical protein
MRVSMPETRRAAAIVNVPYPQPNSTASPGKPPHPSTSRILSGSKDPSHTSRGGISSSANGASWQRRASTCVPVSVTPTVVPWTAHVDAL